MPGRAVGGRLAGAFGVAGAVAQLLPGRAGRRRRPPVGADEAVGAKDGDRITALVTAEELPRRAARCRARRTVAAHARFAGGAGGAAGAAVVRVGLQIGARRTARGQAGLTAAAAADRDAEAAVASFVSGAGAAAGAAVGGIARRVDTGAAAARLALRAVRFALRAGAVETLLAVGAFTAAPAAIERVAVRIDTDVVAASGSRRARAGPVDAGAGTELAGAGEAALAAVHRIALQVDAAVATARLSLGAGLPGLAAGAAPARRAAAPPVPGPGRPAGRAVAAPPGPGAAALAAPAGEVLHAGGAVPLAEVPNLRPGRRAVERAQAAGHVLLADPNRHQRPPLAEGDPRLEAVPRGLADDRQAAAVVEEQVGVLEVAAPRQGEAHVPAQFAGSAAGDERPIRARPLPHLGGEGEGAEPALSGARLGDGPGQPECAEQPACERRAKRGAARCRRP